MGRAELLATEALLIDRVDLLVEIKYFVCVAKREGRSQLGGKDNHINHLPICALSLSNSRPAYCTPASDRLCISTSSPLRCTTRPLPTMQVTFGFNIPDGTRWNLYFLPYQKLSALNKDCTIIHFDTYRPRQLSYVQHLSLPQLWRKCHIWRTGCPPVCPSLHLPIVPQGQHQFFQLQIWPWDVKAWTLSASRTHKYKLFSPHWLPLVLAQRG